MFRLLQRTQVEMVEQVPETLYCAYHPNRETLLRCNRCDKPICTDCAIRTPVGFRCRDCVRGQQAVYYNAQTADLPIAAVVAFVSAAVLGVLAYLLLGALGFFRLILAIFVGPTAGGLIAEAVRRAVGRRRARGMNWVAVGAAVAGMFFGSLILLVLLAGGFDARILRLLIQRWDLLIFVGLAASTIYARLQ